MRQDHTLLKMSLSLCVCVVPSGSTRGSSLCTGRRWTRPSRPSPAAASESGRGLWEWRFVSVSVCVCVGVGGEHVSSYGALQLFYLCLIFKPQLLVLTSAWLITATFNKLPRDELPVHYELLHKQVCCLHFILITSFSHVKWLNLCYLSFLMQLFLFCKKQKFLGFFLFEKRTFFLQQHK